MTEPRRTFAPVVLLGLGSAAALAAAGTKVWAEPELSPADLGLLPSQAVTADMPLAGALGFVLLAGWGVLLVTRGAVRRAVAVLLTLVSLGLVATTVTAFWGVRDVLERQLDDLGVGIKASSVATRMTGWYWVALVFSVVAVLAAAAAVRWCRDWPAMSSRYDAPTRDTASHPAAPASEPADDTEFWKALDAGRDPTDRPGPDAP